jgi:ABC-type Fe3+-siderophore transport system permease subunit
MATSEQYFSLVRTSKSSWVAVPIHQTTPAADAPAPSRLFAQATGSNVKFSERFPRLMIAMIAGAIFMISVVAEVEMLRNAGYFWR